MAITTEQIAERLAGLEQLEQQTFGRYQNAFADYNAILGAKQEAEHWLAEARKAEETAQQEQEAAAAAKATSKPRRKR